MRICPCCGIYGDVWEVEFMNLNELHAVMCFECDSVWETVGDDKNQILDTVESIMKKHGVTPDWGQIKKLRQVDPEP